MAKDTGGPAFPYSALTPSGPSMYGDSEGMTLRDYFAAQIVVPMVHHRVGGHVSYGNEQNIAARAYEIADAMIAERAK